MMTMRTSVTITFTMRMTDDHDYGDNDDHDYGDDHDADNDHNNGDDIL